MSAHQLSYPFYFVDARGNAPVLETTADYQEMKALAYSNPCDFRCRENQRDGRQVDLIVRYLFVFNWTLRNTQSRWIFRGADDTVINFARLRAFVEELDAKYDARADEIVLANCLSYDYWAYPQGGSGMVLSRRAVEKFASTERYLLQTMEGYEDMSFGRYMALIGMRPYEMTSAAFCGHPLHPGAHRECPAVESLPQLNCRRFIAPVNEIVFYHEWPARDIDGVIRSAGRVFAANATDHWHIDSTGMTPAVCQRANRGAEMLDVPPNFTVRTSSKRFPNPPH